MKFLIYKKVTLLNYLTQSSVLRCPESFTKQPIVDMFYTSLLLYATVLIEKLRKINCGALQYQNLNFIEYTKS